MIQWREHASGLAWFGINVGRATERHVATVAQLEAGWSWCVFDRALSVDIIERGRALDSESARGDAERAARRAGIVE